MATRDQAKRYSVPGYVTGHQRGAMEDSQAFDARLTASSRVALDWATWFAADRGGASLAPSSKSFASPPAADTLDLLLGILLAHPAASELRQLLDYFEIPLGALRAALPADHRPDLATVPHGAPSRQPDVDLGALVLVLELAGDLAKQSDADEGLVRIADCAED
jgi:hypothetical protein